MDATWPSGTIVALRVPSLFSALSSLGTDRAAIFAETTVSDRAGKMMPSGWALVCLGPDWPGAMSEEVKKRNSIDQDLIVFEFDAEDLYSRIEYWSAGISSWAVEHCAQRGIGDLRLSGLVPNLVGSLDFNALKQSLGHADSNANAPAFLVPRDLMFGIVGNWDGDGIQWMSLAEISRIHPESTASEVASNASVLARGMHSRNRSWFHYLGFSPR